MIHKISVFRVISILFFCPLLASGCYADNDDQMRYEDHTYRDNIKTVQLHQTTWALSPPIIQLNSHQRLQLDFDDLDGDTKSYYYTFIHCDANWQPSDINSYDYMKGLQADFLTNYSYSFNTYQKYTHYTLQFPNRSIGLLLSGNYILKIYLNNDPDSVIITRRFMVYENLATISGREKQGIGEDIYTKQEIIFSINTTHYPIPDPFQSLHTYILQDGRWDNAIANLQPQFIQDTCLQFYQDDGNSFDGGNQFRSFDMTTLKYNSDHIEGMIPNPTGEELQLKKDIPRYASPYFTFADIDGQYLIKTKDADSSTINSEYVWVHFFMPQDSAFKNGKLYIFGQLSDWQCKPEFEMHYDDMLQAYTAKVYLKQGYYEYEYAFLQKGSSYADVTVIEGNHMETENSYYIMAYYREVGLFYDKMIGYTSFKGP